MHTRRTIIPPPQGVYLGQHEITDGDIRTFEAAIGRRVPLWSPFQQQALPQAPGALHTDGPVLAPRLNVAAARRAWEDGRPIRVAAYEAYPGPTVIEGIPDRHPPGFTIDRLCRGTYDRELGALAASFREFGRPMWFETAREPNGILGKWFGGFGQDGDRPLAWAIGNERAFGEFQPANLPNAALYEDLNDPGVPDGLKRLTAAHRYYYDFLVNREGCDLLTFHTNGWNVANLAEKLDRQTSAYGRMVTERLWDFGNAYPGDPFVDWVTLTLHLIDWFAADWPWLEADRLVSTDHYLNLVDAEMERIRATAPGKPVMFIELGFPDGRRIDSERSADRITAFFRHVRRHDSIRGFSMWADSPIWWDIWPFDSLTRPGTRQADALRAIIDRDPGWFATVVHLSDGSTFPVPIADT